METSIKDYEKELALHPSAFHVYRAIVIVQMYLGKTADAEENLKLWIDAAPENDEPRMMLANAQLDKGDAAGAAATAEEAVGLTTPGEEPNQRLSLLLGRAQLRAGMKDKGHATLLALLNKTEDPDLMNDAAYELADAGVELPLAEKTTRDALDKMEEESKAWTLDENLETLRNKTLLLQATWDTMGWIAFREGKADVAEGYIKASWRGRQSAEVGMHLGEIQLSRGAKSAALTTYDLAAATVLNYNQMGVRKEPTGIQKDLIARAAALRKANVKANSNDAQKGLQEIRKIPAGSGPNGVAEYKLLLSAQGLVRAEPATEKEIPDAMARLKLAKLTGLLPPDSKAQIVIPVILNCHSNTCEVMLIP